MLTKQTNELLFYQFENLAKHLELTHFISTRFGGVSPEPYNSLNLGFLTSDKKENIQKNREILADALKISYQSFILQYQVHSCNIIRIEAFHKGKGILDFEDCIKDNDALITNEPDTCLFVLAADCVPLLLYDSKQKVIAAVHAGWKGTVGKIAAKTVQKMQTEFNCEPENIEVGIGPSIGPCCYEVGDNVVNAVIKSFGTKENYLQFHNQKNKNHFNLWYANKQQLIEIGIPENQIETAEICTLCNSAIFFSARSSKQETGRFGAGIMMK